MHFEIYIFAIVIILYGIFTILSAVGFNKLRSDISVNEINRNADFISIVLSARNEATTIELCLQELIKQQYPINQFEIILIDDASEDDTYILANHVLEKSKISYKLIKEFVHQGKKKNISKAISISKGSVIITTDADVIFRSDKWLSTISNYFVIHKPEMLIMPIDFEMDTKLLSIFQIIENLALTTITAGYTGMQLPFMCNGANLAFKKDAYEKVNGYQSHIHISSGEDVLLLEDIKKLYPTGIHYLLSKTLIIKTKTQKSLKSFFNQRLRWAYKARYNPNALNIASGFIIIMANLLIPAFLLALIVQSVIIPYLSIFVISKCVFDFLLLFLASNYLGQRKYLLLIIPFQCIYWVYALIIGICSFFVKPKWKDIKIN